MEEYVGIDLGGTKTIVSSADSKGNIIKQVREKTPASLNEGLEMLMRMVREVSSSPTSIGCACGGPLDWRNGIVSPVHMPSWRCVSLKEIMEKEFDCNFYVDVDTNVAALGEYYFGQASKYNVFIYITLSTGMGAAKLINGKIYRGYGHPEMGHQSFALSIKHAHKSFVLDEHVCECGAKGCLESYVSGNAIRTIYGMSAEEIKDSNIIDEIAYNFGEGLRNIIALHSPDGIFVGGGVACGLGERLIKPAVDTARCNIKIIPFPDVKLASLGYNSAQIGTIAMAMHGI